MDMMTRGEGRRKENFSNKYFRKAKYVILCKEKQMNGVGNACRKGNGGISDRKSCFNGENVPGYGRIMAAFVDAFNGYGRNYGKAGGKVGSKIRLSRGRHEL